MIDGVTVMSLLPPTEDKCSHGLSMPQCVKKNKKKKERKKKKKK
jgi:hypothetical protein